jgi:hypothetical protein
MENILKQKNLISSNGVVWAVHNVKSLLAPMWLTWPASSSYSGGCSSKSTDWIDPPIGPPIRFFNKLNVIKTHRCRHERNTRN